MYLQYLPVYSYIPYHSFSIRANTSEKERNIHLDSSRKAITFTLSKRKVEQINEQSESARQYKHLFFAPQNLFPFWYSLTSKSKQALRITTNQQPRRFYIRKENSCRYLIIITKFLHFSPYYHSLFFK